MVDVTSSWDSLSIKTVCRLPNFTSNFALVSSIIFKSFGDAECWRVRCVSVCVCDPFRLTKLCFSVFNHSLEFDKQGTKYGVYMSVSMSSFDMYR